jgi:hypothetical protein
LWLTQFLLVCLASQQVGNARKSEEIQILEKRANELLAEYESTATDKAKQLNVSVTTCKPAAAYQEQVTPG